MRIKARSACLRRFILHHRIPGSDLKEFWDNALTNKDTRGLMVDFITELATYGALYMNNAPTGLSDFIQQLNNDHAVKLGDAFWLGLAKKKRDDDLDDFKLKGKYLRSLFYYICR